MKTHHDVLLLCSRWWVENCMVAGISMLRFISRDSRFGHSELHFLKSCKFLVAKDDALCPNKGIVRLKL